MGQFVSRPAPRVDILPDYDYVIVGGGAAGCVLAARLSEDPDVTVVVLETGSEETLEPLLEVPFLAPKLSDSGTWATYKIEPQRKACLSMRDDEVGWLAAGRVLGGGSSINFLQYLRGSRHDFDEWEALGCEGWCYNDIVKYFIKAETYENLHQTDNYGQDGPVQLSDCVGFPRITTALLDAGRELGYPIVDLNACPNIGIGYSQQNVSGGRRCSTVKAYLRPAMSRPNLHVLTSALAVKIQFEARRAVSVRYEHDGAEKEVRARREIVVCAGGIESPKLLLLSGVGPQEHLDQLDVPVVADLPVGEGLQVHMFSDGAAATLTHGDGVTWPNVTSSWSWLKYSLFHKGSLSQSDIPGAGYFRSDHQSDDDPKPQFLLTARTGMLGDPKCAGMANLKPEVERALYGDFEHTETVTLIAMLCRPKSRGFVRLASTDPHSPPVIDPKYLDSDIDVKILAEGVRKGIELLQTKAFQELGAEVLSRKHPGLQFDSDTYWEEYVKHVTFCMSHYAGTCRMGAPHDQHAVVDSRLRVRGIVGLRVADCSIMPEITSGNTHAPTIMIAEKAADMIRADSRVDSPTSL